MFRKRPYVATLMAITAALTACGLFGNKPAPPPSSTPPETIGGRVESVEATISEPLQATQPNTYQSPLGGQFYLQQSSLEKNAVPACQAPNFKDIARCIHFDPKASFGKLGSNTVANDIDVQITLPKEDDLQTPNGTPRVAFGGTSGNTGYQLETGLQWDANNKIWTPYMVDQLGTKVQLRDIYLIDPRDGYLYAPSTNQTLKAAFGLADLPLLPTVPYFYLESAQWKRIKLRLATSTELNDSKVIKIPVPLMGDKSYVTTGNYEVFNKTKAFTTLVHNSNAKWSLQPTAPITKQLFNLTAGISFKDAEASKAFATKGGVFRNLVLKDLNFGVRQSLIKQDLLAYFFLTKKYAVRPWVDASTPADGITHPAITQVENLSNPTIKWLHTEKINFNQPPAGDPKYTLSTTADLSQLQVIAGSNTTPSLQVVNTTWDAKSHLLAAEVKLTNTTNQSLLGYRAIASQITPSNTQITNPTGYTSENLPFIEYGELAAGASINQLWKFYNPSNQPFNLQVTFTPKLSKLTLQDNSNPSFPSDLETVLTLQGSDIRAETAFFIESTKLEVRSWTATTAQVVVPKGFTPSTYGIMAINPNGDKAVLYPAFTLTPGLPPAELNQLANPTSLVEGYVVDYDTQKPLLNAKISIPGLSTTTDSEGHFLLQGVPVGRQNILIEAEGYEPVYRIAEITDLNRTTILKLAELQRSATGSTRIGVNGGEHHANNGSFIRIPPGALKEDVDIHFTQLQAANSLPQLPQDGYFLAFARLEPVGLTFQKPATLFLPLQPGITLPVGTPIRISYYDTREARWVDDITSGVISEVNGRLYLEYEINHFTWIGGVGGSDPVRAKFVFADGSPAPGIVTNYGITGGGGDLVGSAPATTTPINRNLTAQGLDGILATKVHSDSSGVDFGTVVITEPKHEPWVDTYLYTAGNSGDICEPGASPALVSMQSMPASAPPKRRSNKPENLKSVKATGTISKLASEPYRYFDYQVLEGEEAYIEVGAYEMPRLDLSSLKVTINGVPVAKDQIYIDGNSIRIMMKKYLTSSKNEFYISYASKAGLTKSAVFDVTVASAIKTFDSTQLTVPDTEFEDLYSFATSMPNNGGFVSRSLYEDRSYKTFYRWDEVDGRRVYVFDGDDVRVIRSKTADLSSNNVDSIAYFADAEGNPISGWNPNLNITPDTSTLDGSNQVNWFFADDWYGMIYTSYHNLNTKSSVTPVFSKVKFEYNIPFIDPKIGATKYFDSMSSAGLSKQSKAQIQLAASAPVCKGDLKIQGLRPSVINNITQEEVEDLMEEYGWNETEAAIYLLLQKQIEAMIKNGIPFGEKTIEDYQTFLDSIRRFINAAHSAGLPNNYVIDLLSTLKDVSRFDGNYALLQALTGYMDIIEKAIEEDRLKNAKLLMSSIVGGFLANEELFKAGMEVTEAELAVMTALSPADIVALYSVGAKLGAVGFRALLTEFATELKAALAAGKDATAVAQAMVKNALRCLTGGATTLSLNSFNSFAPGTLVLTSTGLLPIHTIQPGMQVWSFNETSQQENYQPVERVFENIDVEITTLKLASLSTRQFD